MAPGKRRRDTSWLPTVVPTVEALVDRGEATRGLAVKTWGGHLILGRVDQAGPDPRFRLTPLGDGRYGLSLYNRNRRVCPHTAVDPSDCGCRVTGRSVHRRAE